MRLTVDTGLERYPVVIDKGTLGTVGASIGEVFPNLERVICIVDEAVLETHMPGRLGRLETEVIAVPGGEQSKSISAWQRLVGQVLDCSIDRATPIVAVGGGSIGDLAGFVAATVLRGVPLIQVPTTLLAMVDSSVGGKTGLNTRHGKNLVGAFHQPVLVHIGLQTLDTLSELEYQSGLGEVVKHAVLGDAELFDFCLQHGDEIRRRDPACIERMVSSSIRLKASIVGQDVREAGLRAVLNLGHTVGHAIEAIGLTQNAAVPHGHCIAMGVFAEVYWSEQRGSCPPGTTERVRELIGRMGLPVMPEKFDLSAALRALQFDKKVRRGTLSTAVVESVGRVRLAEVGVEEFPALFRAFEEA